MIKLISTDFDGTIFLSSCGQTPIYPPLLDQINRMQQTGTKWVINTGRDLAELVSTLEYYRISPFPNYLILAERFIYYRDKGKYLPLQPWNTICTQTHKQLFDKIKPMLPALEAKINTLFPNSLYFGDTLSPICLVSKDKQEAESLFKLVEDYFLSVPELTIMKNDVYARFAHINFSKGTALLALEKHLGITPSETLSAGDYYNDIPMLRSDVTASPVAPANALPEIKDLVHQEGGYISDYPAGQGVLDGIIHYLNAPQID